MTKTIVITGGSRGIGAATARLAGKRGWSVATANMNPWSSGLSASSKHRKSA